MKVQFKKGPGINVLEKDINLTQNGCTAQDKKSLAKLIWADGNLKSTGNSNYVWTTSTDRGYYYTFYSTYTGNKTTNNTDPCSKLNTSTYGTGWRTPSESEYLPLTRCTDNVITNGGMWFMNKSIGIFLLASGSIGNGGGCSTGSPTIGGGTIGQYWTSTKDGSRGKCFVFSNNGAPTMFSDYQATGVPVRCVKNN